MIRWTLHTPTDCEICEGEGRVPNESAATRSPQPDSRGDCGYCNGTGKVRESGKIARYHLGDYWFRLTVTPLPSGAWYASAQLEGACSECLGDNFPSVHEAMAACERYVLC